jgi:uncharacterized protein (TIGR04255 family)
LQDKAANHASTLGAEHACVLGFGCLSDLTAMPDHEIFPNPLVKQVAFEIRFPNLFFIEGKIGEFQVRVMKDFPLSDLILRRSVMFMTAAEGTPPDLPKPAEDTPSDKIWQFRSASSGITLQVSRNNLSLTSQQHNSYHHGGENSFRGVIDRVVAHFTDMVKIPIALRVGLRYINECPIFERNTGRFNECYNSILPVERFSLERLANADCIVVVNGEGCQIRHIESLRLVENNDNLGLDMDAWMENVPSENVMASADKLHEVISAEFNSAIKQPILEFMRKPKGGKG